MEKRINIRPVRPEDREKFEAYFDRLHGGAQRFINPDDYNRKRFRDYFDGKPKNLAAFIAENGVPGGVPAIDFPEITMHRLDPWGAFGADPLPGENKRIFFDVQSIVDGGLTYTEGRFDCLQKCGGI